jgi:hypothetical protein
LELVRKYGDDPAELDRQLLAIFPKDVKAAQWNRELVHKGTTGMGRDKTRQMKKPRRRMRQIRRRQIVTNLTRRPQFGRMLVFSHKIKQQSHPKPPPLQESVRFALQQPQR